MIEVDDEGYVYLRRADYLWRDGKPDKTEERELGDGDIVARIHPDAYNDIAHAKIIAAYIRSRLKKEKDGDVDSGSD
jgi:hypothetical protein